tara:strand:+ start:269 stop:445 length:177 start_codon:yes stop_codon:yes gene_type:complete
MGYKMKGFSGFGDFGLREAKGKARKKVVKKISKGGGSLIEKGKKITEAFSEIQRYTDY